MNSPAKSEATRGAPRSHADTAERSTDAAASPVYPAVLIACEMLEDEVRNAHESAQNGGGSQDHGGESAEQAVGSADLPIVWVESGLHEHPDRLRSHLQHLLDLVDDAVRSRASAALPSVRPGRGPTEARRTVVDVPPVHDVIFAFGYCGNGLQGLISQRSRLVFPRVDDCISLFLNRGCTREEIERDPRAFYLTRGWLAHDNPMQKDYEAWSERLGREKALDLRRRTMASYERISLLDTGAYNTTECIGRSRSLAEELDLDHCVVPASFSLLLRLLSGPWNSEIVRVPPGREVDIRHLFEPHCEQDEHADDTHGDI